MPLVSMTGYGRAEGGDVRMTWAWEARTVNGKSLETRCRVPSGFERFETLGRNAVATRFKRGNVALTLTVTRPAQAAPMRINRELLQSVLAVMTELQRVDGVEPPSADGLMRIKGIVEPDETLVEEPALIEQRDKAIALTLEDALGRLGQARAAEGAHLRQVVQGHLARIDELCGRATAVATAQPERIRSRMHRQLEELLGAVPALSEERFAQEVAILVQKADVREELDRLQAHIEQAGQLIAAADAGEAVGRKFDFLCQEFNREANTLCSKASEIELTRLGIDLKSAVEQLREQVQNIE